MIRTIYTGPAVTAGAAVFTASLGAIEQSLGAQAAADLTFEVAACSAIGALAGFIYAQHADHRGRS
jgi:hypothetical protein